VGAFVRRDATGEALRRRGLMKKHNSTILLGKEMMGIAG
jgi:hypothetical protein